MVLRRLSTLFTALLLVLGGMLVAAQPASAAARILYYDAGTAQEFVSVVNQGAAIWNARATNVKLQQVPAGRTPNIRVYADNGWPRTYTSSLGNGYWYMGREAVNDGYYPPRIAAHEFGHILGLPDRRTGLCTDLMSGSSAPVSCTNPNPNATEVAQVNAAFAGALATTSGTYIWR